ncbi:MAG: hypothetical protein LC102_03055 [Ignavibacteriales bacterium]|nr:MAG: hypothetical protein F9K26_07625 [Ignavibacteriaceae bacterium]MBW7872980.1 hypothetical protein [Ignavibacteria bacterium]MCZ2142391.1 hypothetical protein [Ignavibacteriales bacterium]OQY78647.1 MAG: hypothetical protein B6D45_01970 [Ignavibacteriales bacterium UTCHB3]MBV6445274.1 hypothetical protein [Ignavibacteriaceae bacterium]
MKRASVSPGKISKEIKNGLRVFTDLREAVAQMDENNRRFYYNPKVTDLGRLSPVELKTIEHLKCWCEDYRHNYPQFLATHEIRFCCRHIAEQIAELSVHPLIRRILENKARRGARERFSVLSEVQPVIVGFPSLDKLGWVNVYHYNSVKELGIRFSFHLFERRWSYGRKPKEYRDIEVLLDDLFEATLLRHKILDNTSK